MKDEKILLTADEAISLLPEGEHVHNYVNPAAGIFIGCDYDRADAEKHIRDAIQREIAGPGCQGMKHGLAVWSSEKRVSFFETDMPKLKAIEAPVNAVATRTRTKQTSMQRNADHERTSKMDTGV
jgi:hypothetical protein